MGRISNNLNTTGGRIPAQQADESFLDTLGSVGKGFVKGVGDTLTSVTRLATLNPLVNPGGFVASLVPGRGRENREQIESTLSGFEERLKAENTAEKIGKGIEFAAELGGPAIFKSLRSGNSLISAAQRLYQSALKPSTALSDLERSRIVQTGLDEAIVLTRGGIERTAAAITDLETKLGQAIDEAGKGAQKIKTSALKPFVEAAKKFLGDTADVAFSQKAVRQIDDIYKNFAAKYGREIPLDVAQKIKTNTYKILKSHYDKLSAPTIEASKQLARGLKEGIVDLAPKVGDINKRLGALYQFETALERASGRFGNLNILSLGGKVLLGGLGGKAGVAVSVLNELAGRAGVKSFTAIELNRIGKVLQRLAPGDQALITRLVDVLASGVAVKTADGIGRITQSIAGNQPQRNGQ